VKGIWRSGTFPAFDDDCRAESGGQLLVLSRSRVSRTLVLLETDDHGELLAVEVIAVLALAYCRRCGSRVRILPADALPRKIYSRPVVELMCHEYGTFQVSLREVAWSLLGDRTPSHTTLHRWSEGLGAYALGREIGEVPGATPAARVFAESEARFPGLRAPEESEVHVPPLRFRSEARRERLLSGRSFLILAARVTDTRPPHALTAWQRQTLSWSPLFLISFRTGLLCTSSEHHPPFRSARCRESDPKSQEPP
jgi:hypothetical protein